MNSSLCCGDREGDYVQKGKAILQRLLGYSLTVQLQQINLTRRIIPLLKDAPTLVSGTFEQVNVVSTLQAPVLCWCEVKGLSEGGVRVSGPIGLKVHLPHREALQNHLS